MKPRMVPLSASKAGNPDGAGGERTVRGDSLDVRPELGPLHAASYSWALHCCGRRRDLAEELLQEVYMRVLDGRARFGGRSSTKTWLFGVIRRTAREHARRHWARGALLSRWQRREPEPMPVADPRCLLEERQRNERLRDALRRLPRRQQEVLHLVFYQDMTIDEAAQTLAISLGSARTHFERGKKRVREQLGRQEAP